MSTTTAIEQAAARPREEKTEDRGADWPLATGFFGGVLALYGAIGYLVWTIAL